MNGKIDELRNRVEQAVHSSKGKDVLLYLLCVLVAFVFWLLLSLDTESQRDFIVPVELVDKPDSITMVGLMPPSIDVSVKAKESQLLRFEWGGLSPVKFKWSEYKSESVISISKAKLDTRLRDYFGSSVTVVASRPDSISLPFTSRPGRKVKLVVNADIHPNFQYIISGPITANFDSVVVFSTADLPHSFRSVETEPLIRSGMKDTVRYEVRIKPMPGIRVIPDKVVVTVPVEPLIAKKTEVQVVAVNVPEGSRLITFPSKVVMSYLVPISDYHVDYPVKAFVDYKQIRGGHHKLPVTLSAMPQTFRSVSFSPDSVEYIIENHL